MNFGLSFSYVFQDEQWFKKIMLPAVCMLIPIVGWMVTLGWALKVTRNLIDGVEQPLPDLDFGGDLGRGFFAFLISFVYSLPASILSWLSSGIANWFYGAGEGVGIAITLIAGLLGLLSFALGLVASFISTAAIANYVAKGDLGAGFQLGEIFNIIKSNFADWLLVVVGAFLALGIIAPLGAIACVIGVFLTVTYGLAVMTHLMGQAYNRSQATPSTIEPTVDTF
jgi:hypothetical protein